MTALFQRCTASVNWKPGLLAATRQEQIPEADGEEKLLKISPTESHDPIITTERTSQPEGLRLHPSPSHVFFILACRFKAFLHESRVTDSETIVKNDAFILRL